MHRDGSCNEPTMPDPANLHTESELQLALDRLRKGQPLPDSAFVGIPYLRRRYLNHHIQTPAAVDADIHAALRRLVQHHLALHRHAPWSDEQVSPDTEVDHLAADFEVADIDRQAWSCLYYRYLAPRPWKVKDIGAVASPQAADAAKLVRNRIGRGIRLLLDALEADEQAAGTEPVSTPDANARVTAALISQAPYPPPIAEAPTRFIGREDELAEIARLMRAERVVTLVGPAGVGKTRLLREAARLLLGDFPDGVWLVELAGVGTPDAVPQAVAVLVGAASGGGTAMRALIGHLRDRAALLLLDNCEHLITPVTSLADTLRLSCPRLHIALTSRALPALPAQNVHEVSPLATPPKDMPLTRETALRYASVRLFDDRARLVRPSFRITDRNARDVAELMRRLDGLPLAIELAAAWVNLYSTGEIARRLDERFDLLRRVSRRIPGNLKPLVLALDWSYDLLDWTEQRVLDRLAVFRGSFSLVAAEAICADPGIVAHNVARTIDTLVSKSLVQAIGDPSGERRFLLLDTVREYGLEHLKQAGALADLKLSHAAWFRDWAESLAVGLADPRTEAAALAEIDGARDNVHAALDACSADARGRGTGLRMMIALVPYWMARERPSNGCRVLETLLSHATLDGAVANGAARDEDGAVADGAVADEFEAVGSVTDSAALDGDARIAQSVLWQAAGEISEADRSAVAAMAVYQQAGDTHGLAVAHHRLGSLADTRGDRDEAIRCYATSQAQFEATGDGVGAGLAGLSLGDVAYRVGDADRATAALAASQAAFDAVSNPWAAGVSALRLATLALDRGDLVTAERLSRVGLIAAQALDDAFGHIDACAHLGHIAAAQGNLAAARAYHGAYRTILAAIGGRNQIGEWLEVMAALDLAEGRAERAVQLSAAAHACRQAVHRHLQPEGEAQLIGRLTELHAILGAERFAAAWDQGRRLGWPHLVQAIDRGGTEAPTSRPGGRRRAPDAMDPGSLDIDQAVLPRADDFFVMTVDHAKGAIWAGGPAGLVRFDIATRAWRRYSMADGLGSNTVFGIYFQTDTGELWVGTDGGLSLLHPGEQWTHFSAGDLPSATDVGYPMGWITGDGPPWIALGSARIGRPRPDGSWWWRDLPPPLAASGSMLVAMPHPSRKEVWLGTEHGAVRLFDDGRFSEVIWPGAAISSFGFDVKRDRVYIGAGGSRLCYVEEGADVCEPAYRSRDGIAGRHIYGLAYDRAADWLWVCTDQGAQLLDPEGRWLDPHAADGLPHPNVYWASPDSVSDDMWFMTMGGIGRRSPDGAWAVYRTDPQPLPTTLGNAIRDLSWEHYARRQLLDVGNGRWLWVLGFRFGQPGRLFAWQMSFGHGGVPAEALAGLLAKPET